MDLRLTGKRALVTGASSGIGAAIAGVLAREGAAVAVHGRNRERTSRVAEEIEASGGTVVVVLGDLATDEGAGRAAEQAASSLGGVDVLVNNAGALLYRGWAELEPENWLDTYNVNVVSMVRMIRLLAPPMRERGWGRIVNVSSEGGTMPTGTVMPDYSATKAAINNMTVGLAKELADTGVTANAVSPGYVVTPANAAFEAARYGVPAEEVDWEEVKRRVTGGLGMAVGRLGRPEDVSAVVAFVASPLTDWISGTNFHVDGGRLPTVN